MTYSEAIENVLKISHNFTELIITFWFKGRELVILILSKM